VVIDVVAVSGDRSMSGLIVVGVDGSESSIDALRWAAGQARLTGAEVEVIATWEYPTSLGWAPAWPPDWDPAGEASKALKEIVDKVVGPDADIEVRQRVLEGNAALALVSAARHADLLVVGSRGHGAFAGMLLGSVSEHCATHCPCPVLIIHHTHDERSS
jgi:nucleotide-binding universal stress UspA family protein